MIEGPANWLAQDMVDWNEWVIQLTPEQVRDIDTALRGALAAGVGFETMTKANFPLTTLEGVFADALDRLENGRGFVVIRGLPALDYSKDELRLIYWAIGLHLGVAVSQSSKGDLLGDVRNFGADTFSSTGRGYMSKQHLGFHTDTADIVSLMVLRPARSGGLSMIASSVAIRNELVRTRPDLVEELYKPYYWSWKGQEAEGELPYYTQPIYSEHDGKFSSRHILTHVWAAQEDFPELPRMTEKQIEALEIINKIAEDPKFHFCMMFEPGDIQLLNNHVTYHARTEFEDFEEEDKKRHLLRMWLSVPNSRDLDPAMSAIYQDQKGGTVRGGFPSRTGTHSFETVPARD